VTALPDASRPLLDRDAVMELARPMPTREEIAEAQHDFHTDHLWRDPASCRDWCAPVYLRMADAVLALINGGPK
jgi:hypothetical protein